VNAIKGLGEEFDESLIVQKVLISLPMRFDPNISTLEKREDLGTIIMDKLHGIFIAYEIRTKQENPSKKEATFKEFNKTKKNKNYESKPNCSCSDDSYEDEEIAKFLRKLKRGANKSKGIIPLK
jgi:hypothetical protein